MLELNHAEAGIAMPSPEVYQWESTAMTTATIRVQIGDQAARLFAATPANRRAQLGLLFGYLVEQFAEATPASLLELMDEMSSEARTNGLTPEILDSILLDE